jgi:hypothetical protein
MNDPLIVMSMIHVRLCGEMKENNNRKYNLFHPFLREIEKGKYRKLMTSSTTTMSAQECTERDHKWNDLHRFI